METVAHWTQNSTTDFVYSISSNFVAQIETKMEAEDISQNEIASRMGKTDGRVSQVLNNPGNLSIRVMVELARVLGMKVSVIAYDDGDPHNNRGPIDPAVFVKCWDSAGQPSDLFEAKDAFEWNKFPVSIYVAGASTTSENWTLHHDVYAKLMGLDTYFGERPRPEKPYYYASNLPMGVQSEEVASIVARQPVILMTPEKREREREAA